jgi:hypothetical protein
MAGFHMKGVEEWGSRESRSYRTLPFIETVAFFTAIATLCISIEYALQLRDAPPDGDKMYNSGHLKLYSTLSVWFHRSESSGKTY